MRRCARKRFGSVFLVVLSLAGTAVAQQVSSSDSSTAAPNQSSPDTSRGPSLVCTLDDSQFVAFIHEDIGALTPYLPGVGLVDRGGIGLLSTLSVRGSTSSEVLVLLGNRPVGDPFDDRFHLLSLPSLPFQSLAVYRVGAPFPYGHDALGGGLRLLPRHHTGSRPRSVVDIRQGDFGYSDVEARYSQDVSGHATIAFGGGIRDVDGAQEDESAHGGSNWYVDVNLDSLASWRARYFVMHTRGDADVPGLLVPEGIGGDLKHLKLVRTDHSLSLGRGDPQLSIQGLLYASALSRQFSDGGSDLSLTHKGRTVGASVEVRRHVKGHMLGWGGGGEWQDVRGDVISDDQARAWGFFRDRIGLSSRWKLGVQVRVEKRRGYSLFPAVEGYLLWQVGQRRNLWWSVSRARRYPSAVERLWSFGGYRGDPGLRSERGWTFEAGGAVGSEGGDRLSLSGYYRTTRDWIGVRVSDALFRPENMENQRLLGSDFNLRKRIWRRTAFGGVGQWLHVLENDPYKRPELPDVAARAYVEAGQTFFQDLDVIGRLFVRLSGRETSITAAGPETLPSYELVDGLLILHFKDAKIFFSLENILDRRVERLSGYPPSRRRFRWGIVWQFFD